MQNTSQQARIPGLPNHWTMTARPDGQRGISRLMFTALGATTTLSEPDEQKSSNGEDVDDPGLETNQLAGQAAPDDRPAQTGSPSPSQMQDHQLLEDLSDLDHRDRRIRILLDEINLSELRRILNQRTLDFAAQAGEPFRLIFPRRPESFPRQWTFGLDGALPGVEGEWHFLTEGDAPLGNQPLAEEALALHLRGRADVDGPRPTVRAILARRQECLMNDTADPYAGVRLVWAPRDEHGRSGMRQRRRDIGRSSARESDGHENGTGDGDDGPGDARGGLSRAGERGGSVRNPDVCRVDPDDAHSNGQFRRHSDGSVGRNESGHNRIGFPTSATQRLTAPPPLTVEQNPDHNNSDQSHSEMITLAPPSPRRAETQHSRDRPEERNDAVTSQEPVSAPAPPEKAPASIPPAKPSRKGSWFIVEEPLLTKEDEMRATIRKAAEQAAKDGEEQQPGQRRSARTRQLSVKAEQRAGTVASAAAVTAEGGRKMGTSGSKRKRQDSKASQSASDQKPPARLPNLPTDSLEQTSARQDLPTIEEQPEDDLQQQSEQRPQQRAQTARAPEDPDEDEDSDEPRKKKRKNEGKAKLNRHFKGAQFKKEEEERRRKKKK